MEEQHGNPNRLYQLLVDTAACKRSEGMHKLEVRCMPPMSTASWCDRTLCGTLHVARHFAFGHVASVMFGVRSRPRRVKLRRARLSFSRIHNARNSSRLLNGEASHTHCMHTHANAGPACTCTHRFEKEEAEVEARLEREEQESIAKAAVSLFSCCDRP